MKAKIEQLQTQAGATDFLKGLRVEVKKIGLIALINNLKDSPIAEEESKEKEKKIPEFEDKNYRAPDNLSLHHLIKKEKICVSKRGKLECADIEIASNRKNDIKEYLSFKNNIEEYQSEVPYELVGQQLFNKKALKRLKLLHRLPANKSVIKKMINAQPGKDDDEKYENFYKKYIKNYNYNDPKKFEIYMDPYDYQIYKENKKNSLAGYYAEDGVGFRHINESMHCWLGDGTHMVFSEYLWYHEVDYDDNCFCSVRLLKQ